MVIMRQKFIITLTVPRVVAPNVRPIIKLKVKGIRPIKINAKPV